MSESTKTGSGEPKLMMIVVGDTIPGGKKPLKMNMNVSFGSIIRTLKQKGTLTHAEKGDIDPKSTPEQCGFPSGKVMQFKFVAASDDDGTKGEDSPAAAPVQTPPTATMKSPQREAPPPPTAVGKSAAPSTAASTPGALRPTDEHPGGAPPPEGKDQKENPPPALAPVPIAKPPPPAPHPNPTPTSQQHTPANQSMTPVAQSQPSSVAGSAANRPIALPQAKSVVQTNDGLPVPPQALPHKKAIVPPMSKPPPHQQQHAGANSPSTAAGGRSLSPGTSPIAKPPPVKLVPQPAIKQERPLHTAVSESTTNDEGSIEPQSQQPSVQPTPNTGRLYSPLQNDDEPHHRPTSTPPAQPVGPTPAAPIPQPVAAQHQQQQPNSRLPPQQLSEAPRVESTGVFHPAPAPVKQPVRQQQPQPTQQQQQIQTVANAQTAKSTAASTKQQASRNTAVVGGQDGIPVVPSQESRTTAVSSIGGDSHQDQQLGISHFSLGPGRPTVNGPPRRSVAPTNIAAPPNLKPWPNQSPLDMFGSDHGLGPAVHPNHPPLQRSQADQDYGTSRHHHHSNITAASTATVQAGYDSSNMTANGMVPSPVRPQPLSNASGFTLSSPPRNQPLQSNYRPSPGLSQEIASFAASLGTKQAAPAQITSSTSYQYVSPSRRGGLGAGRSTTTSGLPPQAQHSAGIGGAATGHHSEEEVQALKDEITLLRAELELEKAQREQLGGVVKQLAKNVHAADSYNAQEHAAREHEKMMQQLREQREQSRASRSPSHQYHH